MEEIVTRERPRKRGLPTEAEETGPFQSVEFFIDGVECPHQFRIWSGEPASMFVLVKQSSEILQHLKVGDVMAMKYYTSDSFCPTRTMETEICHITREDKGRFQGHCLVGLAVPQV